jgi:hypothetical protein
MTWTYDSGTGALARNGGLVGTGYSGHGPGVNDPTTESMPNVGPIPRGEWTIGPFFNDPEKGPTVAHLIPDAATATFGRSGFMIHGDTAADVENGTDLASEGCIILARPIREQIAASGDNDLQVV